MQVRLPGQEKWTAAGTAAALLLPGTFLTTIPIGYAMSLYGPKIKASGRYEDLKKLYAEN